MLDPFEGQECRRGNIGGNSLILRGGLRGKGGRVYSVDPEERNHFATRMRRAIAGAGGGSRGAAAGAAAKTIIPSEAIRGRRRLEEH